MRSARFDFPASRTVSESLCSAASTASRREYRRALGSVRSAPAHDRARLEARQPGMRQLPAFHAHASELGAAVQRGNVLARVEEALRVEGALHALEALDLGGAELHAHLVDLLHAHAVLAGDGAADLDAFLQYL